MNKTPKGNPFWRIVRPILIYWVVQIVALIIVSFVLVSVSSEEIAALYATVSEHATEAELENVIANMSAIVMELVWKYYVEITSFIALCTIPVTYYFFRKDRKAEIEAGISINQKAPAKQYVLIPVLGTALCLGFNCLILMTNLAFLSDSYQQTSSLYYSASFPVQLLGIGIIVPLAEELLFRGVVYKRFRENAGFKSAAIFTALFFSMTHASLPQMIYTFVLAMFLSYVYEKYGSFKAPALLHMCVNIVSLVCTKLKILDLLYAIPISMAITIVVCAFAGAVMFIQIQKIEIQKQEEKTIEQ